MDSAFQQTQIQTAVKGIRRKGPMTGWDPWKEPIAPQERTVSRILGKKHQTEPLAFAESAPALLHPLSSVSTSCPYCIDRIFFIRIDRLARGSSRRRKDRRRKGKLSRMHPVAIPRARARARRRVHASMGKEKEREREKEKERDLLRHECEWTSQSNSHREISRPTTITVSFRGVFRREGRGDGKREMGLSLSYMEKPRESFAYMCHAGWKTRRWSSPHPELLGRSERCASFLLSLSFFFSKTFLLALLHTHSRCALLRSVFPPDRSIASSSTAKPIARTNFIDFPLSRDSGIRRGFADRARDYYVRTRASRRSCHVGCILPVARSQSIAIAEMKTNNTITGGRLMHPRRDASRESPFCSARFCAFCRRVRLTDAILAAGKIDINTNRY